MRGFIGLAGPYDFLPLTDPKLIALFSHAPIEQSQPVNFVSANAGHLPPMFLAMGDDDDVVELHNMTSLNSKVSAVGGRVETHLYPNLGHIGLILAMADGFRGRAPVLEDSIAFIERTRR